MLIKYMESGKTKSILIPNGVKVEETDTLVLVSDGNKVIAAININVFLIAVPGAAVEGTSKVEGFQQERETK